MNDFRMPAEWGPHEATWLAWPHNRETWPGKFEKIPSVWVEIVRSLHEHEKVNILVNDGNAEKSARALLQKKNVWSKNILFYRIPTNDAWIRDYGPIFVNRQQANGGQKRAIVDWIFNAWGERWDKRPLDDVVPKKIAEEFGYPLLEPGIVLEGGSIDVNGKGALLTTESCLLSKTRNPHLDREQIEQYLKNYLGITVVLWLKQGIVGDDTSGHIDDIARFVNENTVVCIYEENTRNKNYSVLKENFELLQNVTDQNGKLFNVVPLPMPNPIAGPTGEGYKDEWIPASYANFYIANGVVLVPVFNQPTDEKAIKILQKFFPDRRVHGIFASDLVWGLGGIHCVTQQQPL